MQHRTSIDLLTWAKPPLFLLCLTPAGFLVWQAVAGTLGANPVEALLHYTGAIETDVVD